MSLITALRGRERHPKLNCVDMSRWGGELAASEARALWALGVRNIKVGDGHPQGAGMWARQQAAMWLDLYGTPFWGGTVDAYIYLYMAGSPFDQVDAAIGNLADLNIRIWWLDAEDVESPQLSPAQRVQFLHSAAKRTQDNVSLEVGIYSGAWWWVPNMANSTEFADLPLWDSNYPNAASLENVVIFPFAGREYGGWTETFADQYHDTIIAGGQSVDLDYDSSLDDSPIKDDDMTLAEDLAIASFAAGEERWQAGEPGLKGPEIIGQLKTRDERLVLAKWRIGELVAGHGQSLNSTAASAIVVALRAQGVIDPAATDVHIAEVVRATIAKARITIPA